MQTWNGDTVPPLLMRLSTTQIITIALLPVAFVCVLVDVNQLTQRSSAHSEAMEHGLSCIAFSDPMVGAYPLTEELKLLAQADPQGAAYFRDHGVTVTVLRWLQVRKTQTSLQSSHLFE